MSTFESLDDTFDITPVEKQEIKPIKKEKVDITISDKSKDKEKDYQYARGQIYNIIDKMQESLNGAMEVAEQSDHPRAYEVVFNGAKNAADVVDKLADLHKKMKEVDVADQRVEATQNNTQNNIYMTGSTADLMKMIKDSKQDK